MAEVAAAADARGRARGGAAGGEPASVGGGGGRTSARRFDQLGISNGTHTCSLTHIWYSKAFTSSHELHKK